MFWCENYLFRNTLTDMKTRFFVNQKKNQIIYISMSLQVLFIKLYKSHYISFPHEPHKQLNKGLLNPFMRTWCCSACCLRNPHPVRKRGGGVILSSHCRLWLNAKSYLISILDTYMYQCPDHCVDSLSVIFLREAPNSPMSTPCTRAVQVSIFL